MRLRINYAPPKKKKKKEKRLRYLEKVDGALETLATAKKMLWKEAMSLNGTLSHITFVYPQGRSFLTSICKFIASFGEKPKRFIPRYPPPSIITDLKWWRRTLETPGTKRKFAPRGAVRDLDIWVDACTSWGVGILVQGAWAAWSWKTSAKERKASGRDIGWAEMLAVELTVRYLDQAGLQDADILVRGDNQGVIGAVERGRSRSFQTNESLRRMEVICMATNMCIKMQYVNTEDNRADSVSRGAAEARLPCLPITFELPPELQPHLRFHA